MRKGQTVVAVARLDGGGGKADGRNGRREAARLARVGVGRAQNQLGPAGRSSHQVGHAVGGNPCLQHRAVAELQREGLAAILPDGARREFLVVAGALFAIQGAEGSVHAGHGAVGGVLQTQLLGIRLERIALDTTRELIGVDQEGTVHQQVEDVEARVDHVIRHGSMVAADGLGHDPVGHPAHGAGVGGGGHVVVQQALFLERNADPRSLVERIITRNHGSGQIREVHQHRTRTQVARVDERREPDGTRQQDHVTGVASHLPHATGEQTVHRHVGLRSKVDQRRRGAGRAVVAQSRLGGGQQSGLRAAIDSQLLGVEHTPGAHQTAGGAVQAVSQRTVGGGDKAGVHQRANRACRAGRHASHVLGGGKQRVDQRVAVAVLGAGDGRRDVGHVQHFDIAFAGQRGPLSVGQLDRQAVGVEVSRPQAAGLRGVGAGLVFGGDLRQAGGDVTADGRRPHVARRQEHGEVHHVVGVGRATETDLDRLAVFQIGVGDVEGRAHHALRRVVRGDQGMTDTARVAENVDRGGGGDTRNLKYHGGAGGADIAQSAQGDCCTQRQNALFHSMTPLKEDSCKTQANLGNAR